MVEMLLPHQMQAMKLGCKIPQNSTINHLISAVHYDVAYERIMSAPRVKGHNDLVGDCVPTGACNIIQDRLSRKGNLTPIPDNVPVEVYSAVTGYNPSDPATDEGTDIDQFFEWWKNNSIVGFKLKEAIAINPQDEGLIRSTIENSGAILTVMALALEQQNERVWTALGTPGSWGRHCGVYDCYDGAIYSLTTWGIWQPVDRSYFNQGFVENCYNIELLSV